MLLALVTAVTLQAVSTPVLGSLHDAVPGIRPDVEVYLLTGQSNALGTTNNEGGSPAEYGPGSHPADLLTGLFWSNVRTTNTSYPPQLYGDSGSVALSLRMQQGDGGANRFFWGLEHGLARGLWEGAPGRGRVLIIKCCRGGGGNTFWDKTAFDLAPDSGHMWGHLRDTVDEALLGLSSGGLTFRVRGLAYLQGESNGPAEAAIAGDRLGRLAFELENHIEAQYPGTAHPMRLVVGEIAGSTANATRERTTLGQMAVAAGMPSATFVRTADLPLKIDNLHFGREAKLTIGRRFADAFLGAPAPFPVARYRADLFRPVAAMDVESPEASGFSESDALPGVLLAGTIEGGVPAWRILDDSQVADPGYQRPLTSVDLRGMFDNGWSFRATAKVATGGGMALWSVAAPVDPGWGVPSGPGSMNGFVVDRVGADALRIALWGDPVAPVVLGPGSADAFHSLGLVGAQGSPLCDLFIDGIRVASDIDLTSNAGSPELGNRVFFGSGALAGVGRDVLWADVALASR
ncbi:sialate O-acetylesterase [Planctomycetes bacterium Poly30]